MSGPGWEAGNRTFRVFVHKQPADRKSPALQVCVPAPGPTLVLGHEPQKGVMCALSCSSESPEHTEAQCEHSQKPGCAETEAHTLWQRWAFLEPAFPQPEE